MNNYDYALNMDNFRILKMSNEDCDKRFKVKNFNKILWLTFCKTLKHVCNTF